MKLTKEEEKLLKEHRAKQAAESEKARQEAERERERKDAMQGVMSASWAWHDSGNTPGFSSFVMDALKNGKRCFVDVEISADMPTMVMLAFDDKPSDERLKQCKKAVQEEYGDEGDES